MRIAGSILIGQRDHQVRASDKPAGYARSDGRSPALGNHTAVKI